MRKVTIQVLNKRIQLHYRCPRVPGLEEECRFLKNRVSSNVPQKPPCGLGKPGPLWNQEILMHIVI